MTRARVLVADDDRAFRMALGKALGRLGFQVDEAASGAEAVAALKAGQAAVALLDLQLGDLEGLEVLRRARGTPTRVIVVTGHGTIPAAVEAMRLGAASFVQKPIDAPTLVPLIEDALRESPATASATGDLGIAGASAALEAVRERVRRAGPTDETVLVVGESGVGKELVARALHQVSGRAQGPFVVLNCAQSQPDLFDAELFGYVRGAFTGAAQDRAGLFRDAAGGTLFLDEVGELPEGVQAKLLRALETRAVRPVGSTREEPADVRLLAATNRDLDAEVRRGRFRADLLYRLHVLSIHVPPLRQRPEDVAPIARALVEAIGRGRGRALELSPAAVAVLERHDWPGNVRELGSVLKRAAVFGRGDLLDDRDCEEAISASIFAHPDARAQRPAAPAPEALTLADMERRHILETWERCGSNTTRAALALGIDRRTLQRKLRSYGRDVDDDG